MTTTTTGDDDEVLRMRVRVTRYSLKCSRFTVTVVQGFCSRGFNPITGLLSDDTHCQTVVVQTVVTDDDDDDVSHNIMIITHTDIIS
eukprot:761659-Hanusia_phi.AAC.1